MWRVRWPPPARSLLGVWSGGKTGEVPSAAPGEAAGPSSSVCDHCLLTRVPVRSAGMSAAPGSLGLLTGGGESSLLSSHQAPDTFPQMPTLPIAFDGLVLGPVEEADSLDGPEYEEEEVEIPLSAPPTNQ